MSRIMANLDVAAKLKSNYDDCYDSNSEWRALGSITKVNNIISLSKKYSHDKIIEIGAGEGSVLSRLALLKFGKELNAIDISRSGIELIKKRRIKGLKDCITFDGYSIPYEDKQFDLAILTHVIEHVEHPRKLLYEAARIAKNVFIEVPLEDNIRFKEKNIFSSVGHINIYSLRTIRSLLLTSNLEIKSQKITNSSMDEYNYQYRTVGLLFYGLTETPLILFGNYSTNIFTYHASFLCNEAKNH